jgi:hypothetical protein
MMIYAMISALLQNTIAIAGKAQSYADANTANLIHAAAMRYNFISPVRTAR